MKTDLAEIYRNYIACLNRQDWPQLGQFVDDIALSIADATHVASRLEFDCSPKGRFLGLDVDGRRVSFAENVFYRFRDGKIVEVWSVIDKTAIEAQL